MIFSHSHFLKECGMEQRKDNDWKCALITGASSGFGYEFAKLFATNGYDLVREAQNGQRLNEINSTNIW